jgi:hypothetical protein
MSLLIDLKEIGELVGLSYQQVWRRVRVTAPGEAVLSLIGHEIPLVKDGKRWLGLRSNLGFLYEPMSVPPKLPTVQRGRPPKR